MKTSTKSSTAVDFSFIESMSEKIREALSDWTDKRVEEIVRPRLVPHSQASALTLRMHGIFQEVLCGVVGQNNLCRVSTIHGAASFLLAQWMLSCELSEMNWDDSSRWLACCKSHGTHDCPEWPLARIKSRTTDYAVDLLSEYTGDEPWANVMFQEYLWCFYHLLDDLSVVAARCTSPLEMAVLIGILSLAEDEEEVYLWGYQDESPSVSTAGSYNIYPQRKVGDYRLDFAIESSEFDAVQVKIAIELDGHEFHERTVDQAVHDRKRDRYLVKEGWKVVRYHRKEIADDLMGMVREIVGLAVKAEPTPTTSLTASEASTSSTP